MPRNQQEPYYFFYDEQQLQFPHLKELNLNLIFLTEPDWGREFQTLFRKFPNLEQVTMPGELEWIEFVGKKLVKRLVLWFLDQWVPETIPGIGMACYGNFLEVSGRPEEVDWENEQRELDEDGDEED